MQYDEIMEELKNYYSGLLIVQYNNRKKAKSTIELLVDLILASLLILQIRDAFNWKTAKGIQLDIIGKWLGISRDYKGSLYWNNTFLSYPRSNQLVPSDLTDSLQHGYTDYTNFESDTGGVLTYDNLGFVEQKLDDENYRIALGLKIIKNSINHTCKNIDDAIWEYFGGQVYTTWDNPHEITYHYPASMAEIINFCNYKEVLLAPTGVSIQLNQT